MKQRRDWLRISDWTGRRPWWHQVKKYRPRVNQSKQDELFLQECAVRVSSLLEDWKERYAPEAPEDEPDERFVEACHKLEYVEYLNDLLLMSDQEERTDTVKELLTDGTIARMQTRLDEAEKGGALPCQRTGNCLR